MVEVGDRVVSKYGLSGIVIAITYFEGLKQDGKVVIQMNEGSANCCLVRNFDRFYKIQGEK